MTLWEHDPRYRCCCNQMHIMLACYIVAILEAVFVTIVFLSNIWSLFQGEIGASAFGVSLFWLIVTFAVLIVFLFGLRTHNHYMLIPHLVWTAMSIILLLVLLVLLLVYIGLQIGGKVPYGPYDSELMSIYTQRTHYTHHTVAVLVAFALLTLLAFLTTVLLEIWILSIIHSGYTYIKERRDYTAVSTTTGSVLGGSTYASGSFIM